MIELQIKDAQGKDKVITQNWVSTRTMLDYLDVLGKKYKTQAEYVRATAEIIAKTMGITSDEILDGVSGPGYDLFVQSFNNQIMGITDPETLAEMS